jgi:hypothetical protein
MPIKNLCRMPITYLWYWLDAAPKCLFRRLPNIIEVRVQCMRVRPESASRNRSHPANHYMRCL